MVSGLEQDDEVSQNEIFGPVITVQHFSTTGRSGPLGKRRQVRPGLQRFHQGPRSGDAVSRRLDFGCVWINTTLPIAAEMPHGGFKHSGYGKDLSMYGLEDYTRIKHVMSNLEA